MNNQPLPSSQDETELEPDYATSSTEYWPSIPKDRPLSEAIAVLVESYCRTQATKQAIADEHYWIKHYGDRRKFLDGSDGDMPEINELKRHQQLHKDRIATLQARLEKEKKNELCKLRNRY